MAEPLSHPADIAPSTAGKVDLGVIPLIDKASRKVLQHAWGLTSNRVERERVQKKLVEYLSQLDGLRYLGAVIAETSPYGKDPDNEAGYRAFGGYARDAFAAAETFVTNGGGTTAFPLPATHPALLATGVELAEAALDYVVAFEQWMPIVQLNDAERAYPDVQQSLEYLNKCLAVLLYELSLTKMGDGLDALLHDDWFEGEVRTLTADDCNSLWDVAFLQTNRSLFDDVDEMYAEYVRFKATQLTYLSAVEQKPPKAADVLKVGSLCAKVGKSAIVTIPNDLNSVQKERWMVAIKEWEKTRAGAKFKTTYEAELLESKTRLGKYGMMFDAVVLLISAEKAYEGDWIDRSKFVCDLTSISTSTYLSLVRIYGSAESLKGLKVLEKQLGPIGPFCSLVSGLLSFYKELQKDHPDKLTLAVTGIQVLASAATLVSRLAAMPIVAEAAAGYVTAANLARVVLVGDVIAGAGNVVIAAVMVSDAVYKLNKLIDGELLKNQTIFGVLRARLDYLAGTTVPRAESVPLHEYLTLTDPLQKMQAMMPRPEAGLLEDLWQAAVDAYSGETQLAFFGLPAVFGCDADPDSPPASYDDFVKRVQSAIRKAIIAGNRDGARSTATDYQRCYSMLELMAIGPDDAKQTMYWNQAQLGMIHDDPMMSMAFWVAETF